MHCSYSIEALIAAVRESTSLRGTLRKLGLKVAGGSSALLKAKIESLGLDTAHFFHPRAGRPRINASYVCKCCGRVVQLERGQRKNTYCSEACLVVGRSESLKRSGARESFREGNRLVQLKSWAEPETRERRLAAMASPAAHAKRVTAIRKAALSPELRATRSANARRRWEDDELKNRFQVASKSSRQRRSFSETSPRPPHVPYEGPGGPILVRSKWERDFACWLDRQCLKWLYEPVRVVVEGHPYTPDFYVLSPFGACYVELHRLTTAQRGDPKLEKMCKAAPLLDAPLILVSEDGINAIRRELRRIGT